jgi:microcin C transport system substrate-binding protein
MRKLLLLAPWLLAACGGDPEAGADIEAAAPVDPDVAVGETHYVDELPTYPSQPLPEGLVWLTNDADPEFASPAAVRGGTYRTSMLSFPLTLRTVGPDSNGSFAFYLRSMNYPLVGMHPNTLNYVPLLATHWAFADDGKTVYYRLNPDARWSDGEPVVADDFLFTIDFMRSESIVDPWYNDHYTTQIVNVVKHDDHTISVEGGSVKPQEELLYEYGLYPTPRHFHLLDANWVRDYDWRAPPGTGPYRIKEVDKGQSVTFERVADWWGNEQRYLRHRFNPDEIEVTVIRDTNVAWEYFLRGEIDSFPVVLPNYWHEKAQGPLFDNGFIHKATYFTDQPQPSQGFWLNMDDPLLADRNIRLGLAHAMNFPLMLDSLLRGDYERLNQHYDGYWDYTNPAIRPRDFDLDRADEYFNAAGWTEFGRDGIRERDGQRLAFTVTYSTQEHTPRLSLLREEARKAGVELNLQIQDSSAAFKQILEKQHQIAWMAWSTQMQPAFWEHYHSDNAHVPQTNNITNTDNPELDELIIAHRNATDKSTRVRLAHEIQQRIFDIAMFIPAYKVPYTREAYWRWIRLPEQIGTRTSYQLVWPMDEVQFLADGLFWIDEALRAETGAALREGRTFEPVTIFDTTWRVE